MKIADYLKERAQELKQRRQQVRDFRVFDFNYIPDEPLMREEARPIIDASLRYLSTGIANHLFVFGSRGSGKTLMVNYISSLLAEKHRASVLYVNCRQHNTSFKILAHLLDVKPRGHSLDELWLRFCKEQPRRLILVLDEVDLISDKDRRKDILYLISRSSLNFMTILLSNHPRFISILDESIRSTLQPEHVYFKNYDAEQLFSILKLRANLGLHRFNSALLREISALTVHRTNSDVRVAIKTLYHTALEAKAELESLFERARRDLLVDVLADLNDKNLLILKAAQETPEPFVKRVYERYRQLSRDLHENPFSYMHFYTSLSYLQSIGMILLVSTKVGRAYTNRVEALCSSQLLDEIWRTRFG